MMLVERGASGNRTTWHASRLWRVAEEGGGEREKGRREEKGGEGKGKRNGSWPPALLI
jgi:hypothetical protein